jgi:tRNA pseudouridine55 synthase
MIRYLTTEDVEEKSQIANQKPKMFAMEGVLIIDKPAGMTSHDVVARVRKIIGERKVGHTGTLDPFATGVLVLLVGRATRIAQFLSGAEKEYHAVIRLGYRTDTGDVTGRPIDGDSPRGERSMPGKEEIDAAIAALRGEIEQTPPMYSAKKIGGRKLYEHARRGEEIARQPVGITIHEFELVSGDGEFVRPHEDGWVDVNARVVCSAGTYVRVLAEDLGKRLGVGAHLAGLRRARAGQFKINRAITLDELTEVVLSNSLSQVLISPNDALSHLPAIELDDDQLKRTMNGLDLGVEGIQLQLNDGDSVRMEKNDELIAVGRFDRPRRLIHPAVVLGTS